MNLSDYQEEPDYGDPLADYSTPQPAPARRSIYAPISETERARVRCEKRVNGAMLYAMAKGDKAEAARLRAIRDARPWHYDPFHWTIPGIEGGEKVMDVAMKGGLAAIVRAQTRDAAIAAGPLDETGFERRRREIKRQAEALGATTAKGD